MKIYYLTTEPAAHCYSDPAPATADERSVLLEFARAYTYEPGPSFVPPEKIGSLVLVAKGITDADLPYAEYR